MHPQGTKGQEKGGIEKLSKLGPAYELNETMELDVGGDGQGRLPGMIGETTGVDEAIYIDEFDGNGALTWEELEEELVELLDREAAFGRDARPMREWIIVDAEPKVETSLVPSLRMGIEWYLDLVGVWTDQRLGCGRATLSEHLSKRDVR